MTTTTEWEAKVREAKAALDAAKTVEDVKAVWNQHLGLGHKVLGRLLTGWDIEKMVEKRNGD